MSELLKLIDAVSNVQRYRKSYDSMSEEVGGEYMMSWDVDQALHALRQLATEREELIASYRLTNERGQS